MADTVESTLKEKLKRIFDVKKVTFDAPGESPEQECLFVEVEKSIALIRSGLERYRVSGQCRVFFARGKMPIGYFMKRIRLADKADTKDFFFSNLETIDRNFLDIDGRGFDFVYFFSGQYDPALGTMNSITISEV